MKRYRIISMLTLVLVLLWTSCTEDFLEPEPLSFYAPENTFIDPDGLNSALIACLRNARHDLYGDCPPFLNDQIFSEVAVEGTTDKTGPLMDMPAQLLPDLNMNNKDRTAIGWFWTEAYNRIKYANTVVSRIDVPEWPNEAERNNILGKAYIHRARTYYHLTQHYGDVPLILEEITEPRLDFYSCSRESILQKCKKDLEFAAQWVLSEADGAPVGDVNKATANHLLAKVCLALGDFDGAIAATNAVINDGWHHLMTERFGVDKDDPMHDVTWDLHVEANKSIPENREKIYNWVCSEALTEDGASEKVSVMRQAVPFWGGTGKNNTPTGNTGMSDQPLGTQVGDGKIEIDQVTKYGRGIGRNRATSYIQFDIWKGEFGDDDRHNDVNWMEMEDLVYNHPNLKAIGDPWYGKNLVKYSESGDLLCTDTIRSWYNWPYYKLYIPDPTDVTPDGGNGDWYCYRLAETYLLRAEAYFWKGQNQLAADDVNAIRERAGATKMYTAGEINIGTILDERARELYYEEFRKVPLVRISYLFAKTGKACYNGKTYSMDNITSDNFWYDRVIEKNVFYRENVVAPHYTYRQAPWLIHYPVPANAINANSLGHINQAPGYPGAETNIPPVRWVDGEGEGEIVE
jgi:starch-binding outer membrane protein, SusD/RagB family